MVDGCTRPRFRKELCSSHLKRLQRKQKDPSVVVLSPISESAPLEGKTPEERVIDAGSDFLEVSAENEQLYQYKRKAFLRAIEIWAISRGFTPPRRGGR